MKDLKTISGKLEIVKRLKSSYYGNPRFLISIDGVEYSTQPDASFGYAVENYANKDVMAQVGTYYGKLSINRAVLMCESDRMSKGIQETL